MIRLLVVPALLMPVFALAQTGDLAAQIRSDLVNDPRTAELSAEELNELVAALVAEAEATGEATVYLDAQRAPIFTYDPPPVSTLTPLQATLMSPLVIALGVLVLGVIGVIFMLFRHRRHSAGQDPEPPPAA